MAKKAKAASEQAIDVNTILNFWDSVTNLLRVGLFQGELSYAVADAQNRVKQIMGAAMADLPPDEVAAWQEKRKGTGA